MIFLLVVEILQERIFSDENRTVIDKSRLLHLVITIPAKKNLSVSFSVLWETDPAQQEFATPCHIMTIGVTQEKKLLLHR